MDLGELGPRDVRVGDTFLSITDGAGTYLNVIRTSDFKSHMLVLDTIGNSNSQILGGYFSLKFIVMHFK